MPVAIRNLQGGDTTFQDEATHTVIQWGGYGANDGSDVQEVDEKLLNNTHLKRAIRQKLLKVITEEEAQESFNRQISSFNDRQLSEERRTDALIDEYEETPVAKLTIDEKGKSSWSETTERRQRRKPQGAEVIATVKTDEVVYDDENDTKSKVEKPVVISFGEPLADARTV